ncbi:hypothetical protein ACVNF4_36745, partial [Streptomyces sp. S6]
PPALDPDPDDWLTGPPGYPADPDTHDRTSADGPSYDWSGTTGPEPAPDPNPAPVRERERAGADPDETPRDSERTERQGGPTR